jgi:hypothetical protein
VNSPYSVLRFPLAILGLSVAVLWLSAYLGAYASKRRRLFDEEEREGFNIVLTATLTLLGLIIGFTFSMAIVRYDQRKDYEEAEANAIGTEYVRAGLLPAEAAHRTKDLIRQYLDQRILFYQERHDGNVAEIEARIAQLQDEMWTVVQSAATASRDQVTALAVAGMNDVLNTQADAAAAWRNRIPQAAWLLMAAIALCSCTLLGYGAPRTRLFVLAILPVVLSVALFLIADIDSPRHGLIRVLPDNLEALQQSLRNSR